jgi:hypothetical protein
VPNLLKSQDFRDLIAIKGFLWRATKYSLRAGVRLRRALELKEKKLSFETAVTKLLDARTLFWMGFPRSAGPPRDLKMHPDFSLCGSVNDGIAF